MGVCELVHIPSEDPYPDQRFAVTHPRWEPCAGIALARTLAGGGL